MSNAPKRTIGPFELEKKLGAGGMGIVYQATYVKTGRKVAVKVLSPALSAEPKLLARFTREMDILQKLRHPNIVRYFGGGKSGGQHFYAMELITGGSLSELIKRRGRLPWEQVVEYGVQICQALEHAHRHDIIHRDLKPANLFLGEDGTIKLGDFGIAFDMQATALTAPGRTVGSYAYMAPEQIRGTPPVSAKTDLYTLGCVLYECLTGQVPFTADSFPEMLNRHLKEEPPRVTSLAVDCPVWLETVVMRLLEKDPEARYYDALATQVALEEVGRKVAEQASVVQQTAAGAAAPTAAGDRDEAEKLLGKKRRRRRKDVPVYERAWFLAGCLILLIAGITWAMWPLSEEELFARADALMANSAQWDTAKEKYLEPLLAKYPDGTYAERARRHLDVIELDRVERQVENRAKNNIPAKSEAERLYADAWRAEQDGDDLQAMEKYRGVVELFKQNDDARFLVTLATRRLQRITGAIGEGSQRREFVVAKMREAERLDARGQVAQAHAVWNSVVTLYGNLKEFEPHVLYAQARLAGRDVEPPEFLQEEAPKPEAESASDPADSDGRTQSQ